jgi:membrane dipeptidase
MIVDAHLDLSYNVDRGRDVRQPAANQPAIEDEIATVGLPDLRQGQVGLICGVIFCLPAASDDATKAPAERSYHNSDQANAQARKQIAWYHAREADGSLPIVRSGADLPDPAQKVTATHAILLLEGADPIRHADDVAAFARLGVRAVGLAWQRTRYAGGTRAPGPLTADGRAIVPVLDAAGMIHDTSHLAEESFFELLDLASGPVMASHSNCRAIVPTDRQLSDEMIRRITNRGGVIGINFYQKFLLPPAEFGKRRATLADVVRHIQHICDLAGSARYVGIGTDMDGALGRNEIPTEIKTSADLPRIADALAAANFSDADVNAILHGNWLRFFAEALPKQANP